MAYFTSNFLYLLYLHTEHKFLWPKLFVIKTYIGFRVSKFPAAKYNSDTYMITSTTLLGKIMKTAYFTSKQSLLTQNIDIELVV